MEGLGDTRKTSALLVWGMGWKALLSCGQGTLGKWVVLTARSSQGYLDMAISIASKNLRAIPTIFLGRPTLCSLFLRPEPLSPKAADSWSLFSMHHTKLVVFSYFFTLNHCTLLVPMEESLLPCPPPDTSARPSRSRHPSPLVSFQSDLIYQSVYELIHKDDRATFRQQLHGAPAPSSTQHAAHGECWGCPKW